MGHNLQQNVLGRILRIVPDLTQNVERAILAEELKLSCTNVMLQCLDTESRCIFILDRSILPKNPPFSCALSTNAGGMPVA